MGLQSVSSGLERSSQFMPDGVASLAPVNGHQASLFDIENAGFVDVPFVESAATEGVALMFYGSFLSSEGDDLSHIDVGIG